MATLPPKTIRELLQPFLPNPELLTDSLQQQLSAYLDLLLRWNARVSLTSITDPRQIVQRHFGESLFAGSHLASRLAPDAQLLDFGSGAGFPGLPIQLVLPSLRVTLAESQARKVAFLREVIRTLDLDTTVWPQRVEEMPPAQRFDAITLRAVDKMPLAVASAQTRLIPGGWMAVLAGAEAELPGAEQIPLPNLHSSRLLLWQNVPRGTSTRD